MVGQIVGNYRVLSELSRGGMGAVYRARHELLGREAAIKFLRPELSTDDDLVQRFFDEARAASAIRHPGIIEVYDFGYTSEGDAYYVMELLDGETLGARLAHRGPLGEVEAAAIARDIASALEAAHDAGIIHRDLKPDNIFLVRGGDGGERIKVVDFGIAKLVDRATQDGRTRTGVLMGTPLYMAPEQAREAARIDHRADLYSLGCLLYEMLAGAPPFVAEGAGEIIAMQMFTPPVALRARVPSVSDELDALVMHLLAKEPSERPATAADVHQQLTTAGARVSARLSAELAATESRSIPPTPWPAASALRLGVLEADAPPLPEKRGALGMVAGLTTVLLAAAVIMIVLATRSSDDARPAAAPATEAQPAVTAPASTPPAQPAATAPPPAPVIEPAHAAAIRRPTRPPVASPQPRESGPVVRPASTPEGTITSPSAGTTPRGPVTSKGSPIETSLDDPPSPPTAP